MEREQLPRSIHCERMDAAVIGVLVKSSAPRIDEVLHDYSRGAKIMKIYTDRRARGSAIFYSRFTLAFAGLCVYAYISK